MSKANLETKELHQIAYFDEPGLDRYNINQQHKYYKAIRSDYAIYEFELDQDTFFKHKNRLNNKNFLFKFVGYKLGQQEAGLNDIRNDIYTCNLYWTASDCLLLSCQKAGELPDFTICYDMASLLQTIVGCAAADPLFQKDHLPEALLITALTYSEWHFEKNPTLIFGNTNINNFVEFLQYAIEQRSEGYKAHIVKGKMAYNPLPSQIGNILFVAKELTFNICDSRVQECCQTNINTSESTVKSNYHVRRVYLTPSLQMIAVQSNQYHQEIINAVDGMKSKKVYTDHALFEKASCVDELGVLIPEINPNSPILRNTLFALENLQPPIYQDYKITNDGERDIQFNGCLLNAVIIFNNDKDQIECLRIFETRRGSLICHKVSQSIAEPGIPKQVALVTDDHDQIVNFFGLSPEAKLIYRALNINAYQTVE